MTENPQGSFSHRTSTREFLFNKTDTDKKEDRFGDISPTILTDLSRLYPKLLFGPSFLDQALEALETQAHFGVLAIQMDPKDGSEEVEDPPPPDSGSHKSILKKIDALSKRSNGIWGLLADDRFGLFLPEMTDKSCLYMAKSIQKSLADQDLGTVTIGIALAPTLAYGKHQILENAFKAIDHATFFGPGSVVVFDAVSLNISGDDRYQRGDIEGAISEYLTALEMDPSNVNVHNSLGVCHGVLGSHEAALKCFQTAADIDPKEVMAVYNTGLIQILMGNRDKALACFLKARQLGPDVFEVALQMGKLYLDSGQHDQARETLEGAASIKPDSAPAWSYLGQCYAASEMTDQAIQAYETAIKKNPNDAAALSSLGYLYDLQDRNTEIATLFCKRSVDLDPEEGLFHHRLGRLYLKQDLLEEATEAFRNANERGHDSTPYIDEIQDRRKATPSPP